MQVREIPTQLPKALGLDIDKLCAENPSSAHNIREEWEATTHKVKEFFAKYGPTTKQ